MFTDTRAKIQAAIDALPDFETYGDPILGLLAYGSPSVDPHGVWGRLTARGWFSGVVTEPYLITLSDQSDVFPVFQHAGLEFLYMLEGEVDYAHGNKTYRLQPGDSLYFDADAPHGPETLHKLPARYLSIISYPPSS